MRPPVPTSFRKYSGKLLIKPSRKNVKAFYGKVTEIIESSLSRISKYELIRRLNPVLKGWAQYHKGTVAKQTFSKVDHLIYWRLTRWGLRRHPRKSGKWVYAHYWKQCGSRRLFAGLQDDPFGGDERIPLPLYSLADMKIVRHVKVKGDYNPFHSEWVAYGEKLRVQRMGETIWSAQRASLWFDQGGKCALCEQEIDMVE